MKKNRKRPSPAPAAPAAAVPPVAAPAPPQRAVEWKKHLTILLGLWIAALLVYSNSFQAAFTYDNVAIIQQDQRIRSTAGIGQIFTEEYWYTTSTTGLYRPLTTLSYLFNYTVLGNGARPAGYHWVNFGLHAINIALVHFLGLLLLEEISWAGLLAALWAMHPLLTESVTNVVGRADELAALGTLAGLLCHVRGSQAVGWRKLAWLAGLAVSAAIAVFSKESGAAVVAAMLCYDLTFGKSKRWPPRLAGYAAVAAPLAIFFFLRGRMLEHSPAMGIPFIDNPLVEAPLVAGVLTAIGVIGKYLWLFFWPVRLSCDYSYNQIPIFRGSLVWEDIAALLSLAACLAAAFFAIRAWRRGRSLPCFAIAFFFATLAPTANVLLVVGSIMAERWMYLPSLGLALGVVMGLQSIEGRWPRVPKRALMAAAGVLCLAWSVRTYLRNFDWRDERALWESAERAAPNSFRPYSMLANLLATPPQASVDRAIREAERSTAILNPLSDADNLARAFAVEGMCYRVKGDTVSDPAQKQDWYRKALEELLRARRIDLATRDLVSHTSLAQGKSAVLGGLGALYLELGHVQHLLGRYQEALQSLSYGRQVASSNPEFSEEESRVYREQGDPDRPAVALLEGLFIDPRSQRLTDSLIQFYKQTAPLTCAVENQGKRSAFNPKCPLVHNHICEAAHNVAVTYREFGKMDQATATAQAAIFGYGCPANLFP
jgi:tetratricopeptide (TPR) repeat protein